MPADAQHPHGAETVRDRAGERLADAPQHVLDRQREGEHVAAPAVRLDHGVRKSPSVERGPKVIIAIRQPPITITAGVRQPRKLATAEGGTIEFS